MFTEPEGYYEPEKQPTFAVHRMQNGQELNMRLVGHNPLWVGLHLCVLLLALTDLPATLSSNVW